MTRHLGLIVLGLALAAAPADAQRQKKTPEKAVAPPVPEKPAGPPLPSPPPNFQYSSEGRRDPFLSLLNRGTDAKGSAATKRAEGAAGLTTGELTVRGILFTRGAYVAMVAGPDGKVFTVRAGSKLADGVIRTITAEAIVVLQEVNDPLSLEKQREVRKLLRGGQEVK
jgi:Tfp pilus assembly protein PilP